MDQINLNIDNNGFKKLDGNFFGLKNDMLKDFESVYENKKFRNNTYKNTSIISQLEDLKKFQEVKLLYNKINQIFLFNNITNLEFDDIWFVKSVEEIYEPSKLPYVPHIDKIRKLKVMIYLNDVEIEDGPLFIIKTKPSRYENFRKKLKPDYKIRQENEIKDLKIEDYFPLKGKFGTAIVFDTNTPHFAGKLHHKNSLRKIIRFNFRLKSENFIKSFVKNLF